MTQSRLLACHLVLACLGLSSQEPACAASQMREFDSLADYAEVVSGGFSSGNRVRIRVGQHTFYDNVPSGIGTAGLYAVAILSHQVLLQTFYNTYATPGASEGLARDIEKLPAGTLVIVAAKDEPTRLFDARGQAALQSIGAATGLLGQAFRTSYLCLGVVGLPSGEAIEKVGTQLLQYTGSQAGGPVDLSFPPDPPEPEVSTAPGIHEGLKLRETEAIYYIPKNFDAATAEYFFAIHGAGDWHRPGAMTHISQFRNIADQRNLVVIAPAFDPIFNWPPNRAVDMDANGNWKDRRIIRDFYLWDFVGLLNAMNEYRTDSKLIEIFQFFNRKLMRREKFHLYGHSGGGQFVPRFATFHAELIDRVAASSGGSYPFPRRDKDYPYGLDMHNLEQTYGHQIKADDLKLSDSQLDEKMNRLLDLRLFLIVGGEEHEPGHPEEDWQGVSTLDKTCNYYAAMQAEDGRLKAAGLRDASRPFLFELHVMPGVGHDWAASGALAQALLFGDSPTPTPTATPTPAVPGDIYTDGRANGLDLLYFSFYWQKDETDFPLPGDFDNNHRVDEGDLLRLIGYLSQ